VEELIPIAAKNELLVREQENIMARCELSSLSFSPLFLSLSLSLSFSHPLQSSELLLCVLFAFGFVVCVCEQENIIAR
jgi:hypothetical protein